MTVESITEAEARSRVLSVEEAKSYVPKICSGCGIKLNRWDGWRIRDEMRSVWCRCGAEVDLYQMTLGILRSSEKWIDSTSIPGSVWYHATHKEDWYKGITSSIFRPLWVHVGTHHSAKSRACTEGCTKTHKIQVSESASVSPDIYIDHNEWYDVEVLNKQYDVIRYINRWESVGSISLLVKPSVLTLA